MVINMARRKKELPSVHRKNIADAAQRLFMTKGVEGTSMSDIAREAGYSKATLYVYLKNKEELIGVLVLESMQKLYDYIRDALNEGSCSRARYKRICEGLVTYQEEFPFYFKLALETINIDFETTDFLPEEKETFAIGERIIELLAEFLQEGIRQGEIRSDIEILPTVFGFWGMLSGLVLLASNKETYINRCIGKSRAQFMDYGFDVLYDSIAAEGRID